MRPDPIGSSLRVIEVALSGGLALAPIGALGVVATRSLHMAPPGMGGPGAVAAAMALGGCISAGAVGALAECCGQDASMATGPKTNRVVPGMLHWMVMTAGAAAIGANVPAAGLTSLQAIAVGAAGGALGSLPALLFYCVQGAVKLGRAEAAWRAARVSRSGRPPGPAASARQAATPPCATTRRSAAAARPPACPARAKLPSRAVLPGVGAVRPLGVA